jgi:CheY-like chemotaxis protein
VRSVEGSTLRFAVADTGPGIPTQMQALIFDAFQQEGAGLGGTGLGLTISRQLVELMGGRITVESELGRGSTFSFTIPFPVAGAAVVTPDAPAAAIPRAARILLADDSRESAMIVSAFLKNTGYCVETAANGAEALDFVRGGAFDLVLMDVEMPVMDGNTAARAIREWEAAAGRRAVPILALTAHALQTEVEKSLQAGCTAHLAKPIGRDDLLRAIDTLLAARRAASA